MHADSAYVVCRHDNSVYVVCRHADSVYVVDSCPNKAVLHTQRIHLYTWARCLCKVFQLGVDWFLTDCSVVRYKATDWYPWTIFLLNYLLICRHDLVRQPYACSIHRLCWIRFNKNVRIHFLGVKHVLPVIIDVISHLVLGHSLRICPSTLYGVYYYPSLTCIRPRLIFVFSQLKLHLAYYTYNSFLCCLEFSTREF